MLTEEEQKFMDYWEHNRNKRGSLFSGLSIGLPLALFLVAAIFFSLISGWHKRATMMFNTDSSLILVLLVAVVVIVFFMAWFAARHRRDMNEQRYRELKSRSEE
jgi:membrane protein YdbS with pleckstrin-like domain